MLPRILKDMKALRRCQASKKLTRFNKKISQSNNFGDFYFASESYRVEKLRVLSEDLATTGKYFQTWKANLSTIKTVSAAFHPNNKEAKRELTSQLQQRNPALLPRAQMPRSNVGQVAHVSPTP